MQSRKIAIVLNTAAGAGKKPDVDRRLVEIFDALGIRALVHAVPGREIAELVAESLRDGCTTIVAAGGDGTVNGVASALVGSETPLGVLPLGTLNHFAKDLRIPLDLEEAARTVAGGVIRKIDVGEVNGKYFVNNSSIGMYPSVVRGREREQRLGRSKWVALFWAGLAVLRRFPTVSVRLIADDGRALRQRTPLVFIGNNPYEMRGLEIGRRPSLETGKLAVYVLHHEGARSLLRMALEAVIGRLRQGADFDFFLTEGVKIEVRRRQIHVATDGEVNLLESPLAYGTHPGALRVLAPAPAPSE